MDFKNFFALNLCLKMSLLCFFILPFESVEWNYYSLWSNKLSIYNLQRTSLSFNRTSITVISWSVDVNNRQIQ